MQCLAARKAQIMKREREREMTGEEGRQMHLERRGMHLEKDDGNYCVRHSFKKVVEVEWCIRLSNTYIVLSVA